MIRYIVFVVICIITQAANAQNKGSETDYDRKMEWWREAKFGMFIHWGPYSIYGGMYNGFKQVRGGAEWIMNRCKIPVREYKAKSSNFNPVKFDAEQIVKQAKDAGMKYIVFTTKHHDGFAMFKSSASSYNIVDYTPFKRDVVAELAEACRKNNMKLGFYYSQSQDWVNPGGGTIRKKMWEGWPNPDSTYIDQYTSSHRGSWDCLQQTTTFEDYFDNVALPQIKELLNNYGDVAVMWWDTPHRITNELAEKIKAELAKYPQIITNDRLKRPNFPGDYKTPEGTIPKSEDVEGIDWETCMNIGSSWGYKSYESNWKTTQELIRNLLTISARGGNYLLNVGPDSKGTLPVEAVNRLNEMGKWIKVNGEAIYGTQRSLIQPSWGECIRKDSKKNSILYLCVFNWPVDGKLIFNANYKVKKATLLYDNSSLNVRSTKKGIELDVPVEAPDKIASVIRLELNEKLVPIKLQSNSSKIFKIVDE